MENDSLAVRVATEPNPDCSTMGIEELSADAKEKLDAGRRNRATGSAS
jgi:hypothetical protein